MKRLKVIERRAGRNGYSARWTARPLDIDIIDYGGRRLGRGSSRSPPIGSLVLPHPHMHERAFVLVPLAEIAPKLEIAGVGRLRDLLAAVDTAGIEAID